LVFRIASWRITFELKLTRAKQNCAIGSDAPARPNAPAAVVAHLQERLTSAPGFASYGEIQQWLEYQYGVSVAYRTVHERVRYKLKAKLKVPCPVSPQASITAQQAFKLLAK
jgi:hypothetical protein